MGLEEDINQERGFSSEQQKAMLNILYTHGWLMARMKESMKEYDLTPQQFNVLRILRGAFPDPLSTLTIRNRMLDRMSDASRIVDRLCKKGLVKSSTCSFDKRKVDVNISEPGLALLTKIDNDKADFKSVFNAVSDKDAKHLNETLDWLRDNGK
ncbi:MAG: MarR family 2-MHQ and catechol resistance regulon transcriptional repressor [Granulosicoccus sp.]|jgi:MarR family 2-MHQ and catechol resistance regulon transcriptional repressor